MKLLNIEFLDSPNYFPTALSTLQKAFGLPNKFKKEFCPHLFNTKENEEYIYYMPPLKYYDPASMMIEQRNEFLKWYNEHIPNEYHFKNELLEYCKSDPSILSC